MESTKELSEKTTGKSANALTAERLKGNADSPEPATDRRSPIEEDLEAALQQRPVGLRELDRHGFGADAGVCLLTVPRMSLAARYLKAEPLSRTEAQGIGIQGDMKIRSVRMEYGLRSLPSQVKTCCRAVPGSAIVVKPCLIQAVGRIGRQIRLQSAGNRRQRQQAN